MLNSCDLAPPHPPTAPVSCRMVPASNSSRDYTRKLIENLFQIVYLHIVLTRSWTEDSIFPTDLTEANSPLFLSEFSSMKAEFYSRNTYHNVWSIFEGEGQRDGETLGLLIGLESEGGIFGVRHSY